MEEDDSEIKQPACFNPKCKYHSMLVHSDQDWFRVDEFDDCMPDISSCRNATFKVRDIRRHRWCENHGGYIKQFFLCEDCNKTASERINGG